MFLEMEVRKNSFAELWSFVCENRAYFVKPLVFSAACVALYFVAPVFAWIAAAGSFGACDFQEMKLVVWIGCLLWILYKLWNWEL